MKKILIMLLLAVLSINCVAQTYTVKGNTYTSVKKSTKKEGIKTPYTWEDSKGNTYQIYILDNGRCYVNRVSGTTGKQYRQYLSEDVSKDIAKKVGVAYTYVKKSKSK